MNNTFIGILIAVQFLMTMLFYPLRIGAYGHVSLARDRIELNVTVLGRSIVRLRLRKNECGRYKLLINGRPFKSNKKVSATQIKSISDRYRIEGLKVYGNMLALVGTQDARTTAMLCALIGGALQPMMRNLNVYTAASSDTLEIDGRLKIKINVLQIISLIYAGIRGSNG